jgi:hypothetical protein
MFLHTIIYTWQQVAMMISVALKQSTVRNLYRRIPEEHILTHFVRTKR